MPNWLIIDIENIDKVGFAEFEVPEAGDQKEQANEELYPDLTITRNMGDKTLIREKTEINDTTSLGDSNITLDGYQFTEFVPNEYEAPRFEDFDTGIVLLNVKLLIENNEDEDIDLSSQKAKLTLNNGKQYTLNALMLSHYSMGDVIESGTTNEAYVIFILDKEQYEKIWKDKPFELEYGPFYGVDSGDISKGKSIQFVLPE